MKKLLLLPIAALGVFLDGPAAQAQIVPRSPVGTWDCTLGGRQVGLAVIRFDADFTLTGIQLMRPNPSILKANSDVNPRNTAGAGRGEYTGDPSSSSGGGTTEFVVGGEYLGGLWGYDTSGKIIGLLDQFTEKEELVQQSVTNVVMGTNMTLITNIFTTNVLEIVRETNGVTMRGVVVPGQRLNLTIFTPRGQHLYRGLPSIPLADFSGEFFGTGKRGNLQFVEFLSAAPAFALPEPLGGHPNTYVVQGVGAGYGFNGVAIFSRHRKAALHTVTIGDDSTLATYSGPFNLATGIGTLKGRDTDGKNPTYRLVRR